MKLCPVSVIVPMKNAENYISDTLKSILQERDVPLEVIVVNDNSMDSSAEKVMKFYDRRIRMLDGPDRGISACMNAGLAAARGALIMRCDADDLYPPMRLRRQVEWLEGHPDYGGVCGGFSMIDADGNFIADMPCGAQPEEITAELTSGKLRTHFNTYAVRSSLIANVGGFREFFNTGEDLDFQLRLGELGRIAYVPQNWYHYRIHDASICHVQKTEIREYFKKTAIKLQNQRRAGHADDLQLGRLPSEPIFNQPAVLTANEHIQDLLTGRAWREHTAGFKVRAIQSGLRGLALNPWRISMWKTLIALVIKSPRRSHVESEIDQT